MAILEGLVAAPFTPFAPDGQLHLPLVPTLKADLVRDGVGGAFVAGTTGEGLSLSSDERMRLAEAWCEAPPKGLPIVVHVGHASVVEARRLAAHAAECGATAVGFMPASPYRFIDREALLRMCAEVAGGAAGTPFFYYHIPSLNGVGVSMAEFAPAATLAIPSFAGIKFTHEELSDYALTLATGVEVLFGRDEILLAGLALGARGAIGSLYNFAAPLFHRLLEAFHHGDLASARATQLVAQRLVRLLSELGGLPAQKAAMTELRSDVGPVRLPLVQLDSARLLRLRHGLAELAPFGSSHKEP